MLSFVAGAAVVAVVVPRDSPEFIGTAKCLSRTAFARAFGMDLRK